MAKVYFWFKGNINDIKRNTIETDNFLFYNLPAGSGSFSCDQNVFKYVKVYGNFTGGDTVRYYRNFGETFDYTDGTKTAMLMSKIDCFRIQTGSNESNYSSNFKHDVLWNDIEEDVPSGFVEGEGDAVHSYLGHYYITENNILKQASYTTFEDNVNRAQKFIFEESQNFGPRVWGSDVEYFATNTRRGVGTESYWYEVIYDDFGTNTDGQDVTVEVSDWWVNIGGKIYYKKPDESVMLIERPASSWTLKTDTWSLGAEPSVRGEFYNTIPVYGYTYYAYTPNPYPYPLVMMGIKSNTDNKNFLLSAMEYYRDDKSPMFFTATATGASILYKIYNTKDSFTINNATSLCTSSNVLKNSFSEFVETYEKVKDNEYSYRVVLPAVESEDFEDDSGKVRFVAGNSPMQGWVAFDKFQTTIWSSESFDSTTHEMGVAKNDELVRETWYAWDASAKQHRCALNLINKICLNNGILKNFNGWSFLGTEGSDDYNIGTRYSFTIGNRVIASQHYWACANAPLIPSNKVNWGAYLSWGYVNSGEANTYAHSVIIYKRK